MACSFEKLVLYLDKQLDIDGQLEVLNHIDECDVCQDAVYQISLKRFQSTRTGATINEDRDDTDPLLQPFGA